MITKEIKMAENLLFDFLKKHKIEYSLFEHQSVFTADDKPVVTAIDGVATSSDTIPEPHFKTLFLKDQKGKFFLVSVFQEKRVDLNALSVALECGRFSFGKAEDLLDLLKLTPGSVTPFGLLFDQQNKVTFVLDEDALINPLVSFHPMRNDMTIVTTLLNFLTCMEKMGHKASVVRIPEK
jgi:Ala-tRNA(Pro) deacylase